ncbi:tRNA-uridine aminocarboxypropyltransferase [Colwellia sp. 6_MG-2023]|uniref:tRNA-uridine aminocarboxypropyltransferase n=1 Tax=Colwellia sp. 6_MG-2023 TaxID=3062676 RepID=UPI0026E35C0A|nr:tRNA-uridine aminocarboxypropyltransferase [Colwellia sp. 6_MG-2023]MDO6488396.1 tRNA-uridine aminocarboxypropyltransferase [Colwellia sp. 6_MG-2023]
MARNLCTQCQRPTSACICRFIIETHNKTPLLVLQHPNEVKQSKGTVALLNGSLTSCKVLVGEDFTHHTELNEILASHQVLLLYPGEHSQILSLPDKKNGGKLTQTNKAKPLLLLVLDGTWKKSYRMFMLSKNLHSLSQVSLPDYLANNGQYLIRKVAKKNALSSLEATCYALALLEGEMKITTADKRLNTVGVDNIDCGNYQPMLNNFIKFNHFQLSFRG